MRERQVDMMNLQIRLPREMVERIDIFRQNISMRPSRTQVIRWMLENSLGILETPKNAENQK